jgi:hypothetical protein
MERKELLRNAPKAIHKLRNKMIKQGTIATVKENNL